MSGSGVKISGLPDAGLPLAPGNILPTVQASTTAQATVGAISDATLGAMVVLPAAETPLDFADILTVFQGDVPRRTTALAIANLSVARSDQINGPVSVASYINEGEWDGLIAGTSTYDCTGAFNAALAANKHVVIPPWTFSVGDVALNDGNVLASMLPVPMGGQTSTWETEITRPVLRAIPGCVAAIDIQGIYYPSLRGLYIDGGDTAGCNGVSGGGRAPRIEDVTIVRCNYGISGAALRGSETYTRGYSMFNIQIAQCAVGIRNLIDSHLILGQISACTRGIELLNGANANEFIGVRVEWCSEHGIHLVQCKSNRFTGGLVDRCFGAGAFIQECPDATFTGMDFNRNGAADDGSTYGDCHVALVSNSGGHIGFSGCSFHSGAGDGGAPPTTPKYLFKFGGTNASMRVDSHDLSGYTVARYTGADPLKFALIGPGIDDAHRSVIQTAWRPWFARGQAVQDRKSANVAAASSVMVTLGQVGVQTFDRSPQTLIVAVTNVATGFHYSARFPLILGRNSGGATIAAGAVFGEISTAGYITVGGAGTVNLTISNVAADGTTFDVAVANAGANQHNCVLILI